MKKFIAAVLVLAGIMILTAPAAEAAGSKVRLGVGANYWVALEDINDVDFDDSGLSGLITFQYLPLSWLKIEVDAEFLPEGFLGSTEQVWLPQAYLLLGDFIYGGAGSGCTTPTAISRTTPSFALKAGIDIPIGPIHLDIDANYRFEGQLQGSDIDTDTIFLGAAVRFGF